MMNSLGAPPSIPTGSQSPTLSPALAPTTGANDDNITTIFVVGFPDDMQEREFQNMFTFCQGFEAATLKVPSSGSSDTDESSLSQSQLSAKKQIIGFAKFKSRADALEARDLLSGRKVDADKSLVLKAEMAKKNLHTKRGGGATMESPVLGMVSSGPVSSGAAPMGRSSSSIISPFGTYAGPPSMMESPVIVPSTGSTSGSSTSGSLGGSGYPRRRSTLETALGESALMPTTAVSGLSREFIAEMTAAATPLDLGIYDGKTSTGNNAAAGAALMEHPPSSTRGAPAGIFDSSSSTTASLSRGSSATLLDNSAGGLETITSSFASSAGPLGDKVGSYSSFSSNSTFGGDRGFNTALFSSESLLSSRFATIGLDNKGGSANNNNNSNTGGPVPPPPPPVSVSSAVPAQQQPIPTNNLDFFPPLGSSKPGLLSTSNGSGSYHSSMDHSTVVPVSQTQQNGLTHIDLSDPTLSLARLGISGGDQNPPCNTLYVGNLPMDASEDELRHMFSQCAGYKRLCFKNKANGPMCFVEFEDVQYATQALFQLYGNPLSNSTKGGIRLSYSKNPLGVRPHHNNNNNNSHQQQQGPMPPSSHSHLYQPHPHSQHPHSLQSQQQQSHHMSGPHHSMPPHSSHRDSPSNSQFMHVQQQHQHHFHHQHSHHGPTHSQHHVSHHHQQSFQQHHHLHHAQQQQGYHMNAQPVSGPSSGSNGAYGSNAMDKEIAMIHGH